MLLHSVPYDMSATSTPQRHSRGALVPGIDTGATFDKHSTAFQFHGCLTPPQSAHDSRRPSYAELPNSAASTVTSCSVPPTPSHHTHYGHVQIHGEMALPYGCSDQWLQPALDDKTLGCMSEQALDWPIQTGSQCYPVDYNNHMSASLARTHWQESLPASQGFAAPASSLQSTLCSTGSDILLHSQMLGSSYVDSASSLSGNASSLSSFEYDTGPEVYYHTQGLVNPSQVSPQDKHVVSQCSSFEGAEQSLQSDPTGFDVMPEYPEGFELLDAPSPVSEYCSDEAGYVNVKSEFHAPQKSLALSSCRFPGGPRTTRPGRVPKRTAQGRKRAPASHTVRTFGGIEMVVEGDELDFLPDGVVPRASKSNSKKHGCHVILKNGRPCPGRFLRGEHLKRHMGSHAPKEERQFPCPLKKKGKKCDKQIGRSDNACDHFKTHMRLTPKNRRNDWFHWDEIKPEILASYEPKPAGKIIANLERWLHTNESVQLQRAHDIPVFSNQRMSH